MTAPAPVKTFGREMSLARLVLRALPMLAVIVGLICGTSIGHRLWQSRSWDWSLVIGAAILSVLLWVALCGPVLLGRYHLPTWYSVSATHLGAVWPGRIRRVELSWSAIASVTRTPRRWDRPLHVKVASVDGGVILIAKSFPAYDELVSVIREQAANCRRFEIYQTGSEPASVVADPGGIQIFGSSRAGLLVYTGLGATFLAMSGYAAARQGTDLTPNTLGVLAMLGVMSAWIWDGIVWMWRHPWQLVVAPTHLVVRRYLGPREIVIPWSAIIRVRKIMRPRWLALADHLSAIEAVAGRRLFVSRHLDRYDEFLAELRQRAVGCQSFDPWPPPPTLADVGP